MKQKIINGILYSAVGSFWWGIIGVLYFKYVSFVGHIELVIHRTIWTAFILIFTTTYLSKWNIVLSIVKDFKKLSILFLTGLLIFTNWGLWIYAVVTNRLIDASFGYYIFPILSVFFGIVFFKEQTNRNKIISILLVFLAVIILLFNFESLPWIGLSVALSWSFYNLIRKKINIPADIGLFVETLLLSPIAILAFYFISKEGNNFFTFSDLNLAFILFLAGLMTLVPLYLYLKGVELAGLGTSGMIFFIAPTGQFLLGFFYFEESFNAVKLLSFCIIWVAVFIYLKDLNSSFKK
jgi:chloramphenicol-sensitive protein RarD|tara:strand:- start:607 stop:1488 length:882 start_codon:yes stop_codon:yes gene_type:complete